MNAGRVFRRSLSAQECFGTIGHEKKRKAKHCLAFLFLKRQVFRGRRLVFQAPSHDCFRRSRIALQA